jgi:iron complex transport system substrate-binding protein
MIYHNPEVKEKLEEFGIPVLVEHSSYESHPMGRSEWIKLYGALLGLEDQADEIFAEQTEQVRIVEEAVQEEEQEAGSEEEASSERKTVVFFYISSNGYANVRRSGDYLAQMIEIAGGTYLFDDLTSDSSVSTVNMGMEEFYARAKDADCLIYNSTIEGEISTTAELLEKSPLLADFKAVQEGNVWCTGKNLFQETTSLSGMIVDLHRILGDTVDESELQFLHRIQ